MLHHKLHTTKKHTSNHHQSLCELIMIHGTSVTSSSKSLPTHIHTHTSRETEWARERRRRRWVGNELGNKNQRRSYCRTVRYHGGSVVLVPVSEGQRSSNPLNTDCSVAAFIPLSTTAWFPPSPPTHFFFSLLLWCLVYIRWPDRPRRVWREEEQEQCEGGVQDDGVGEGELRQVWGRSSREQSPHCGLPASTSCPRQGWGGGWNLRGRWVFTSLQEEREHEIRGMGRGAGEKEVMIEEIWCWMCSASQSEWLGHKHSSPLPSPPLLLSSPLLSSPLPPLLSSPLLSSPLLSSPEHSVRFSSCCCLGCLVSSWQVKGSCVPRLNTLTQRAMHSHIHTFTCRQ